MKKSKKLKTPSFKKLKLGKRLDGSAFRTILATSYVLVLLVIIYHIYFAKKIIPGVVIGPIDVGGMTYNQAKSAVTDYEESLDKMLILQYEDQEFEFDPSLFDLEYSIDATVVRAFEVGRTGNILVDSKDKIAGLVKPLRIRAFYEIDDGELSSVFSTVKGEINQPSSDAYYEIVNGALIVVPAAEGLKVNDEILYNQVISSLENLDFSEKVVEVKEDKAKVSEADLEVHLSAVSDIVLNPLVVVYEEDSWALGSEQLLSFVDVVAEDKGGTELNLNKPAFEAYMDSLALEVDQLPRGKVTSMEADQVTGFEIIQDGRELNKKEFTEDFRDAFFGGRSEVELAVDVVETGDPEKYGIYALLGEGTSYYKGSASSRIHNLSLAAERASGVLVPPGEVYSFNNAVGYISGETGYASAYIITNGRTVLGDGGGVCQTSTTLFRAALNAGLPIVTRHPHAYRVYYYEIESPVGFDASIYQPSLDFQFKNDTPNYILVQTFGDKQAGMLGFRIFGTPDGREVEISDVAVTNQSAPPETLYQDDPTLNKGVVKQVDFAAWGATTSFDRLVTDKDGDTLYEDTFKTNYRPWRAIYLVGTKD